MSSYDAWSIRTKHVLECRNFFEARLVEDTDLEWRDATKISKCRIRKCLTYYDGKLNQGPPDMLEMTPAEEKRLWKRRKRSPRARKLLVLRYLAWAFRLASKFKGPRLEFDEAVSAANAGLMEAMDSFDYTKGVRFIVYSYTHIRRHLINAVISTYPVKVSDYMLRKISDPDPKKLQERIKTGEACDHEELFKRLSEGNSFNMELLFEKQADAPFMPSEGTSPSENAEEQTMPEELSEAVALLEDPIGRTAVLARYYKVPPETFDSLAKRLGVTKIRVREAHDLALVQLRRKLVK